MVERHNKTVGLKLTYKWDRDAAQSILFRSDQYPLLLHDIPAVWWFTGFHPGLSPGDRHGGEDQLREDDADSEAGVSFGLGVCRRAEPAAIYTSGDEPELKTTRRLPRLAGQA